MVNMVYIMTEGTLVGKPKGKELKYSLRPGKFKKQADCGCLNGVGMLLSDRS